MKALKLSAPLATSLVTAVLLSFGLSSALQAQSSAAEGAIRSVTVYGDRALVSRVLRVSGQARNGKVVFDNLPARVMQNSFSASARGAAITGVSLVPIAKSDARQWKHHPLQKNYDRINADLAAAKDRLSTHQEQLKVLSSYGRVSSDATEGQSRTGTIDVQSWSKALDFLEQKRTTYQGRIRAERKRIKALEDDRRVAHKALHQLTKSRKTAPFAARVAFAGKQQGSVEIILQYMVSGVSWRGFYDLRGSSEGNGFKLVAHANIRQSTGENWRNVQVTLSSARPSVGTSPGKLEPWRVSSASLGRNKVRTEGRGKNDALNAIGNTGGDTSSDAQATSAFSIKLPGRETILSNNAAHEITLNSSTLKGEVSHVALPSISEYVYLRARLDNTSGMPVFPGKINVFLDGNFMGKSHLKAGVAAGERFDLFLGPDQRMRLKRKLLRGDVEGAGVFTKSVNVVNQWQIEVGNYSRKARKVIIYDQYPIPADPNISTKYLGSSIEAQANANGILRWEIAVQPGKQRKFDFSYSMSVPTEMWNRLVARPAPAPMMEQDDLQNRPVRKRKKRQYNLEQMFK